MAKIIGLPSLSAKVNRMQIVMEDEAIRAMEKNGEELVAMQKRLVGKDELDLMDSIEFKHHEFKKGPGIVVTAGSEKAYYAKWHEHGTSKSRANPFFFGSYRALRRRFKARVSRWVRAAMRRSL